MDGWVELSTKSIIAMHVSADGARLFLVALRGWVELGR